MNPDDYWCPFETAINSYSELLEVLNRVLGKWAPKNRLFAWRGQVCASWPLHSSLYRRVTWTSTAATPPIEEDLYNAEDSILASLHRWGLHVSPAAGRLSVLNQLATLQHYGAPTRLIDVTFNPWIGAWFACEQKVNDGTSGYGGEDARLFAIDVTNSLINENHSLRDWEDDLHRPWPKPTTQKDAQSTKEKFHEWTSRVYAWKPPRFDGRMAAQNGGFIFGGVPSSVGKEGKPVQFAKIDGGRWLIDQVRTSTSLALRPHILDTIKGGVKNGAVYSFRIKASAKKEIRERLEKGFGYQHRTIYPDYTGFAQFACSSLRNSPRP